MSYFVQDDNDTLRYRDTGDIAGAAGEVSFAFWFRLNDGSTGSDTTVLRSLDTGNQLSSRLTLDANGTTVTFEYLRFASDGSFASRRGTFSQVNDSWKSAIVTDTGGLLASGLHLYVDGTELSYVNSDDTSGTPRNVDWAVFGDSSGFSFNPCYFAELGIAGEVLGSTDRAAYAAGTDPASIAAFDFVAHLLNASTIARGTAGQIDAPDTGTAAGGVFDAEHPTIIAPGASGIIQAAAWRAQRNVLLRM